MKTWRQSQATTGVAAILLPKVCLCEGRTELLCLGRGYPLSVRAVTEEQTDHRGTQLSKGLLSVPKGEELMAILIPAVSFVSYL